MPRNQKVAKIDHDKLNACTVHVRFLHDMREQYEDSSLRFSLPIFLILC